MNFLCVTERVVKISWSISWTFFLFVVVCIWKYLRGSSFQLPLITDAYRNSVGYCWRPRKSEPVHDLRVGSLWRHYWNCSRAAPVIRLSGECCTGAYHRLLFRNVFIAEYRARKSVSGITGGRNVKRQPLKPQREIEVKEFILVTQIVNKCW